MNFSKMVKEKRSQAKMSYRKLAEETGISHSHIRDIENGKYTPSYESAIKLAKTLDINIQDVIISTYQSQFRNLLFDLIKTCDDQQITLPHEVWIKSNLPLAPIGMEKTELHDMAFEIAESLYTEKRKTVLDSKLELIKSISQSNSQSSVYQRTVSFINAMDITSTIYGLPNALHEADNFIARLDEKNSNYQKGDD